jgi:cysteine desulfurase/selenocysteine lyase
MWTDRDVAALRKEFPILAQEVYGRPLVYFDNAASAQKPNAVLDAMSDVYRLRYANVHRGVHKLSMEATAAFEQAREQVRKFVNAEREEEIIFTKGGTEAINLVADSLGSSFAAGDEVLLTEMEHHSNIVPWHFLRERHGVVLKFVPIRDDGALDLDAFEALLSPKTKLVAVTHMSNVLGTVNHIADIIGAAHQTGAKVLIDGCQGAVHRPVDVRALDCDFYAATGHKLYGPTGIGFLYGKYELLRKMRPYQGGGEMIRIVTKDAITYADPPHRFEAGTPPIVEAIGLGAAVQWLSSIDRKSAGAHEDSLLVHATEALAKLNRVKLFGRAPGKGSILTFEIEGVHAHDVSTVLDVAGVAVRGGHHCAQILMERLGVTATVRASFAPYNTHEEVDALVSGVHDVMEFFK